MNEKIDIVVPWVDGNDLEWRAEKDKWKNQLESHRKAESIDKGAISNIRYENWDNMQYWFRSIEKNLPWINKIFFVTCGHLPKFLNTNNPKLRIVNHKDYIPEKYLPTFSSRPIEFNYHRIRELSENFILFNDDMFPLQSIEESYYFKNNQVCDSAIEMPIMPVSYDENDTSRRLSCQMRINNLLFINKYFKKREVQAKNPDKWFCTEYEELLDRNKSMSYWDNFCGFYDQHMPSAMKKSTLKHLWELEPNILDQTSQHRFRHSSDVNQWLIRYWQLCEGNFVPRKTLGKYYAVTIKTYKEVAEIIRNRAVQTICLTEYCTSEEFVKIKQEINSAFEEIFPNKSSFEI